MPLFDQRDLVGKLFLSGCGRMLVMQCVVHTHIIKHKQICTYMGRPLRVEMSSMNSFIETAAGLCSGALSRLCDAVYQITNLLLLDCHVHFRRRLQWRTTEQVTQTIHTWTPARSGAIGMR